MLYVEIYKHLIFIMNVLKKIYLKFYKIEVKKTYTLMKKKCGRY